MASVVDRPEVALVTPIALATRRRLLLVLACGLAAAAAWVIGDPAPRLAADPETAWLLRAMALLKATFVLATVALAGWRFGMPIGSRLAFGYGAVAAVMTGAAAMVWQLSFLALTSFAFHAALIALLLVAWRDGGIAKGPLAR